MVTVTHPVAETIQAIESVAVAVAHDPVADALDEKFAVVAWTIRARKQSVRQGGGVTVALVSVRPLRVYNIQFTLDAIHHKE